MAMKSISSLPMEKYAKARTKQIKAKKQTESAPMPAMSSIHEARYDFDTLTRAEEIKRDKTRHKAAKGHARQQLKHIKNIVSGGRRSPMKVKES